MTDPFSGLESGPDGKLHRLEGRDGAIYREYVSGNWSQEDLARKYNISQSRVSKILKAVRESIPEPERAEIRQILMEQIGEVAQMAKAIMEMAPAPVVAGKDGTVVYDPETQEVVRDHSGRINAANLFMKAHERLSKLYGADAPAKSEVTVIGEDEATRALSAEAAARLAGEE